jgi:hypothetical protein
MGPGPSHNDNMILDYTNGFSPSGFGHPDCKGGNDPRHIIETLDKDYPTSGK